VDTPRHTEVERTGKVIRVREYETLGEIAARELGSSSRWTEIANLNGIRDPKSIRVGQELMIPSAKEVQGSTPPKDSNVSTADANGWRYYTVQSGDVPGKISQKVYGTAKLWEGILEANDISDPRELRVGQKLRIPPKP
jgi:nucleoid-associated protein YgaU